MLKHNLKKNITAIILLISLAGYSLLVLNTNASDLTENTIVPPISSQDVDLPATEVKATPPTTIAPTIIDAKDYNLDTTGASDTSSQFQVMIDSYPRGSALQLPSGTYKISNTIKLKDGIKLVGSGAVIMEGTGNNKLISTGNDNSFEGIEFQNCDTALSVFKKDGVNVINCKFTNNITFSAINFYGANKASVTNSYFYDIRKYGILIDDDSSDITIDNNNFDNAKVFAGYSVEQISGHVYCLNGTNIKVRNNILKNSGGQGVIFGYNSSTGKGTTNSVASNNICEGNGQEGATIYGGSYKVTSGNSLIGNTAKNNRFNQIEVWQTDNNIVKNNTVEEAFAGTGNLGAITLFDTTGTTVTGNKVLSSQSNGIAIVAGTTNLLVSNNYITDTNRENNTKTPEMGNGILLDWNGKSNPKYITIRDNVITSSNAATAKSGVYSTSATNHHNKISNNTLTNYKYGVHYYAQRTCGL